MGRCHKEEFAGWGSGVDLTVSPRKVFETLSHLTWTKHKAHGTGVYVVHATKLKHNLKCRLL